MNLKLSLSHFVVSHVFNWLKTAKMIVNKQPLFLPEKADKLKTMLALSAALMVLRLCVSLT